MAAHAVISQVNRCSETEITSPSTTTTNTPKPKVPVKIQSKRFLDHLLCCFRAPKKLPGNNLLGISSSSPQWALLQDNLVIDEIEIEERPLLKPVEPDDVSRKCVVIDLDETLVHSSFMPVNNADFVISIDIDGVTHQVYVSKRPHVDEFLQQMGQLFECVLFTASLGKYADPVTDLLDKTGAFQARLFRESCIFYEGNYVKDLSRLGRDLKNVVILDNSPSSYLFQPNNAVPILSWFDDPDDVKLLELLPFFEQLAKSENACEYLRQAHSLDSSSNVQEVISLPT